MLYLQSEALKSVRNELSDLKNMFLDNKIAFLLMVKAEILTELSFQLFNSVKIAKKSFWVTLDALFSVGGS